MENKSDLMLQEKDLLEYLQNEGDSKGAHDIEAAMQEDPFLHDALEGLSQFNNTQQIESFVGEIQTEIRRKTRRKKGLERKSKIFKEDNWVVLAAIFLVLAIAMAYFFIQYLGTI